MMPGTVVANVVMQTVLQFVWDMMNDLSFLTSLSLVSLNIPGLA